CDQLAAHNVQMSTDNETMSRTLETLERRVAEAQDELIQTKDVLRIKKLEGDQEQRRREKIEKELKDMKALIEQKQTEIQGKQATIEQQRQE
ncbi:flagellar associated protein, partial [Toxoplasma gondii p89]